MSLGALGGRGVTALSVDIASLKTRLMNIVKMYYKLINNFEYQQLTTYNLLSLNILKFV